MTHTSRPSVEERVDVHTEVGYSRLPLDWSPYVAEVAPAATQPIAESTESEIIGEVDPHPPYVQDFIAFRDEELARGVDEVDLQHIGYGVPSVASIHAAIARGYLRS